MIIKYLLPKARNLTTQQVVKTQDLNGVRYTLGQRAFAESAAQELAAKMSATTGHVWEGFVEEYVPSQRRS